MEHHVALPPDSMGKITYVAPPGQYSLKVLDFSYLLFIFVIYSFVIYLYTFNIYIVVVLKI